MGLKDRPRISVTRGFISINLDCVFLNFSLRHKLDINCIGAYTFCS